VSERIDLTYEDEDIAFASSKKEGRTRIDILSDERDEQRAARERWSEWYGRLLDLVGALCTGCARVVMLFLTSSYVLHCIFGYFQYFNESKIRGELVVLVLMCMATDFKLYGKLLGRVMGTRGEDVK
jgi:hypothetical protein